MTIEKAVTFGIRDLSSIGIECPECRTLIVIPLQNEKGATVDESLYCPPCRQDGTEVIWTANAETYDKRLAAALIEASQHGNGSRVRMTLEME